MHNLSDKDILDSIKFIIAWFGALIAIVMAVKSIAKEFGNRGTIIEGLQKNHSDMEKDIQAIRHHVESNDLERAQLRKDVDKLESDYESLIEKLLERFKTTRQR